jgi:hypothetical protein
MKHKEKYVCSILTSAYSACGILNSICFIVFLAIYFLLKFNESQKKVILIFIVYFGCVTLAELALLFIRFVLGRRTEIYKDRIIVWHSYKDKETIYYDSVINFSVINVTFRLSYKNKLGQTKHLSFSRLFLTSSFKAMLKPLYVKFGSNGNSIVTDDKEENVNGQVLQPFVLKSSHSFQWLFLMSVIIGILIIIVFAVLGLVGLIEGLVAYIICAVVFVFLAFDVFGFALDKNTYIEYKNGFLIFHSLPKSRNLCIEMSKVGSCCFVTDLNGSGVIYFISKEEKVIANQRVGYDFLSDDNTMMLFRAYEIKMIGHDAFEAIQEKDEKSK